MTTATATARKVLKHLYITPEQRDRLEALSARTRVPMAVYIRDGIDLILRKHFGK